MTLHSNCIGLLLKWTPEIIYLQKSAVNSPIKFILTVYLILLLTAPPNHKILFFKKKFNVITFH